MTSSSGGCELDNDEDDDDIDDSYSVCTHEAISCYERTIELLDRSRTTSEDDLARAELYACTWARLADCFMLTNQVS